MSVIYILIPVAILLTALGIYLFFWAVKTDQFEDLEKQGMSILFDDETNTKKKTQKPKQEQEQEQDKDEDENLIYSNTDNHNEH
jgi:cbb3-type cytochrome oxidase maturation protein